MIILNDNDNDNNNDNDDKIDDGDDDDDDDEKNYNDNSNYDNNDNDNTDYVGHVQHVKVKVIRYQYFALGCKEFLGRHCMLLGAVL